MVKAIVETNNYFTEEKWIKKINDLSFTQKFNFTFFDSEKQFMENIDGADACFSLSFRKTFDYDRHNIKLLYLGISDIDFLDTVKSLKNTELYFAKGFSSKLIAEYALMASFCLIRNMEIAFVNKKRKVWDQEPFLSGNNKLLENHRIGVLGLGNNGMAIVRLFNKLGCQVEGLSINKKEDVALSRWYPKSDLEQFLANNDIVIIALPLRTDTNELLGSKHFRIMGSNSYLINTSRFEIINENDLIGALNSGTIKAAALDVSSIEDLPESKWWNPTIASKSKSKLWETKNLLISPHISGNANIFVDEIQHDFMDKLSELK